MARISDPLETYRKKRHFKTTPGPAGKRLRASSKAPIFVIQKHDASRLHYDFRIEAAGVLKSRVVPKGPSTNPKDKRPAMPTEDHAMEYAKFEAVIPEGEYGAGPSIIWDAGTYRNLTEVPIEQGLRQGIKIRLDGKKLKGGYALTRMSARPARWLLAKDE